MPRKAVVQPLYLRARAQRFRIRFRFESIATSRPRVSCGAAMAANRIVSYVDLDEAQLDTQRLGSALEELAAAQRGGEKSLWQLRTVPASETDDQSLPGFTPRSSTPLNDSLACESDGGGGGRSALGHGDHRHGPGGSGRDAAWRQHGACAIGAAAGEWEGVDHLLQEVQHVCFGAQPSMGPADLRPTRFPAASHAQPRAAQTTQPSATSQSREAGAGGTGQAGGPLRGGTAGRATGRRAARRAALTRAAGTCCRRRWRAERSCCYTPCPAWQALPSPGSRCRCCWAAGRAEELAVGRERRSGRRSGRRRRIRRRGGATGPSGRPG